MIIAIFNIGPIELLIMAAAAVMLFGGDLPATARKAARTLGRLRGLATELGREFSAEEHLPKLPKRSDFDVDLKRLVNLDDNPQDAAPSLPGRREDEPIPSAADEDELDLPTWRKSLASELPDIGSGSSPDTEGHAHDPPDVTADDPEGDSKLS